MGHHYGNTAIRVGKAGNALGRTVGIGGIGFRHPAPVVHIAQGNTTGLLGLVDLRIGLELSAALAMRHRDRQPGTFHALQQDGVGTLHLHHTDTGFKALGLVAHKMRPVVRAGNQRMQVTHHLTAVTDPKGKGVVTLEKRLELIPGLGIEQDGLGPTFTGTQYISIGETTTGHQTVETIQGHPARQDVTHVHIYRTETGGVEGPGHLDMSVHTLLPQYRHLGAHAGIDHGGSDVVLGIKGQRGRETGVVRPGDLIEFLLGALAVVPQRLNTKTGLRPGLLQGNAGLIQQWRTILADGHLQTVVGRTQLEQT